MDPSSLLPADLTTYLGKLHRKNGFPYHRLAEPGFAAMLGTFWIGAKSSKPTGDGDDAESSIDLTGDVDLGNDDYVRESMLAFFNNHGPQQEKNRQAVCATLLDQTVIYGFSATELADPALSDLIDSTVTAVAGSRELTKEERETCAIDIGKKWDQIKDKRNTDKEKSPLYLAVCDTLVALDPSVDLDDSSLQEAIRTNVAHFNGEEYGDDLPANLAKSLIANWKRQLSARRSCLSFIFYTAACVATGAAVALYHNEIGTFFGKLLKDWLSMA